jgi:hypothetical protein
MVCKFPVDDKVVIAAVAAAGRKFSVYNTFYIYHSYVKQVIKDVVFG